MQLSVLDEPPITLPFASVPSVIKSGTALKTTRMMDDDVFYLDYENKRIGIGTQTPRAELDVRGTVNATEYIYGDGSGLYNLPHAGSDNYNFLSSRNGEFMVVTVNVAGKVMIGSREGIDVPDASLQLYGSFLVEPNNNLPTTVVSGAGSRWMWHSELSILRIGDTPSVYWDDITSGNDSIAMGHASIANAPYSIITGGYYNQISSANSIVSSGSENLIKAENSIILGGSKNTILGIDSNVESRYSSIILGGFNNTAQRQAIVLGGFENTSKGDYSVVAGYSNSVLNQQSLILGGKHNFIESDNAIALGSNIRIKPNHPRSFVIGLSDLPSESLTTSHINIHAPGGIGIGTTDTSAADLTVSGTVTGNIYYGDGSLLTNIKDPESVWQLHPMRFDLLAYQGHAGVGTSNLLEALNVSGSIQLSGEAMPENGTIRYVDDAFSVYKDNMGWVGLQMVDTNTTYNAENSLGLDEENLRFYVASKNAKIGHIKRWNGSSWVSGFMDLFLEEAEPDRLNELALPKRLFLPTSNVVINIDETMIDDDIMVNPVSVFTKPNQASAIYLSDSSGETDRMISISTDPPGIHFQGFYAGMQFQQTPEPGAGMYLGQSLYEPGIDDGLMMYVEDAAGSLKDAMFITSTNVHVMGVQPPDTHYKFYVDGDFATKSFVFRSDSHGTGLYLKDHFLNLNEPERAAVAIIRDNGELFIQSANTHGSVVFLQAGRQVAMLQATQLGKSRFGLSRKYPRGGLDVLKGHVHVSDAFGIHFYNQSTKRSGISFDSTNDQRIQIATSGELDVPNVVISKSGNVDLNGNLNNNRHDLFINNVDGRDTIVELNTVEGVNPGIIFHVDGVQGESNNDDFLERGETYSFQMDEDDLVIKENASNKEAITLHQNGFIGFFDATPTSALSIGADVVMLNQSGLYIKEMDGSSGRAIVMNDNEVQVHSSRSINWVGSNSDPTLMVGPLGVGVHRRLSRETIERTTIGFELDGSLTVSGDIYNEIDDKIFPLDVTNSDGSKAGRSINTLQINTASGLSLTGENVADSKLTVHGQGFYSRIKLPPCTFGPHNQTCLTDQLPNLIFDASTRNVDLRLVGRGITITVNNRESRGLASDVPSSLDTLNIINDLLAGGDITGPLNINGSVIVLDKIMGNAHGIRNIDFHWQHVQRNNPNEPKGRPYREPILDHENVINYTNDGEIYYTEGKVGIHHLANGPGVTDCPYYCVCELNTQCWQPSTLFEVVGTSNVQSLILFEQLQASDIRSTDDMHITSDESMNFRSNQAIVFGRDDMMNGEESEQFKESMRITDQTQWLVGGIESSDYLVDVGRKSQNAGTEFRIDSDSGMSLMLNRSDTDLTIKGRMKVNHPQGSAEVQLDSPLGFGFYTNTVTRSITLDPKGMVGVFTARPKNTLDVNGAMAIEYEEKAPTDGLIVLNNVGVGMDTDELPLNKLEIGGSVVVGDAFSNGVCNDFCIRGDGNHRLWIGGTPIGTETAFVSKNISIKNGALNIRDGIDVAMSIQRGDSSVDNWSQLAPNKGLDISTTQRILFQSYSNQTWGPELVIDSAGQGRLGVGTIPNYTVHIKDDDNDALVKIRSGELATFQFKHGDNEAIIGSNETGFHFKTHAASLDNPEITIVANAVNSKTKLGIMTNTPHDHYVVDVAGTVNADDYIVEDEFSQTGYRSFQTVPTGVIILWTEEVIPEGWVECGKNNAFCPDMTHKYVKGPNSSVSNIGETGGANTTTLSSVSHEHTQSGHTHKLDQTNHNHTISTGSTGDMTRDTDAQDGFIYDSLFHVYPGYYVYPPLVPPHSYGYSQGTGNHAHAAVNYKHKHQNLTVNGSSHDHKNSSSDDHTHGPNTNLTPNNTVGTGNAAVGRNGDEHKHELDAEGEGNRPLSRFVRFIVKVDEP